MHSNGQANFNEINFNKIEQKKIREYIHLQEQKGYSLLEIRPSLYKESTIDGFRTETREYFLKGNLQDVWKHYTCTNPGKLWNGKKVTFGMLFSKKEKRIVYKNDYISSLDTGQVVYLNLKFMSGLANLAIVFEFITVDNEKRIIEFSYIDGHITEGKQQLQFIETPRGYTQIIHTSFYKSKSILRDHFLYPYFHTRVTNEFHRNMKKLYFINQELLASEKKHF